MGGGEEAAPPESLPAGAEGGSAVIPYAVLMRWRRKGRCAGTAGGHEALPVGKTAGEIDRAVKIARMAKLAELAMGEGERAEDV